MQISRAGVELVAGFEGFVGHPYRDAVGVWTIGFGHTHGVGPHTPSISLEQGKALLQRDLDLEYAPIIEGLHLPLNQHQFDALVSFVYNVGAGGVATSSHVGRALRAHNWHEAADHLLDWDRAGGQVLAGLRRRREAERALFLKPVQAPDPLAVLAPSERRAVRAYDTLLRQRHNKDAIVKARATITVLRKILWRHSQPKDNGGDGRGWNYSHRTERYKILSSRTQNG